MKVLRLSFVLSIFFLMNLAFSVELDGLDPYYDINGKPKVLAVSRPDLVITSVTAASTVNIGGKISVAATVKNQGGATAGNSRVTFYVSDNNTISQYDTSTTYGCDTPTLLKKRVHTCSGDIPIPSTIKAGTYYIGAYTDDNNVVSEKNENNNGKSASHTTIISGGGNGVGDIPYAGKNYKGTSQIGINGWSAEVWTLTISLSLKNGGIWDASIRDEMCSYYGGCYSRYSNWSGSYKLNSNGDKLEFSGSSSFIATPSQDGGTGMILDLIQGPYHSGGYANVLIMEE